jgi:regulator of RNase E activity RraA
MDNLEIKWNEQSKHKEYGVLTIPVPSEIDVRLYWNGYCGRPSAYIYKDEDGVTRLHLRVKRDLVKEAKSGKSQELQHVPGSDDI